MSQSHRSNPLLKGIVYFLVGIFTYPGYVWLNRLRITGMEKLRQLPDKKVLFVSNHQTYFADVICFIHIFCAARWRKKHRLGIPFYLLWPKTNIRYIAAATTMKKDLLSRFFTLAGAITVKRTWNEQSGEKMKGLDISDTRNIARELEENWVVTFPQGTTTPFAPGRKGTAFIIRQCQPIVVPIVIKGFSSAFNKTGLKLKNPRTKLEVQIKDPIPIDYNDNNEIILAQIMEAIEQSKEFEDKI